MWFYKLAGCIFVNLQMEFGSFGSADVMDSKVCYAVASCSRHIEWAHKLAVG